MWGEDTSLPPVTLQHVGERWYQPGIGRFIQRDPIGLRGGMNVYAYVINGPNTLVDPDGLYWDYDDVNHRDGSVTHHFYDRGWTGWFKNEFQYSVTIPPGKTPPAPPRTFDQKCMAVAISTAVSGNAGFITGGISGIPGGPEGMIVCAAAGAAIGAGSGFVGGIIVEFGL